MENDLSRAQRYHEQAKALREMAAQEIDEHRRTSLLELSQKYMNLCEKLLSRGIKKPL